MFVSAMLIRRALRKNSNYVAVNNRLRVDLCQIRGIIPVIKTSQSSKPHSHQNLSVIETSHEFRTSGREHGSKNKMPLQLQGGAIGAIATPKTYENNFIHHDFAQFGKQHSWLKAILSSIVLSQQCCEIYSISLIVAKHLWDLTTKYFWNLPPPWLYQLDTPWLQENNITSQHSGTTCQWTSTFRTAMPWTLCSHNLPTDGARELFKRSKDAWSLLGSISKILTPLGLKLLYVWHHD